MGESRRTDGDRPVSATVSPRPPPALLPPGFSGWEQGSLRPTSPLACPQPMSYV